MRLLSQASALLSAHLECWIRFCGHGRDAFRQGGHEEVSIRGKLWKDTGHMGRDSTVLEVSSSRIEFEARRKKILSCFPKLSSALQSPPPSPFRGHAMSPSISNQTCLLPRGMNLCSSSNPSAPSSVDTTRGMMTERKKTRPWHGEQLIARRRE